MRLSVAPVSGRHDPAALSAFYREVAECRDVTRVYLGELFCAKRLLPLGAFSEAVAVLEDAGKEAVFSTMALPASDADFEAAVPYAEKVSAVEVNNFGYVPWLKERFPDKVWLAGPICNLYNLDDLKVVRDWGCAGVSTHVDLMPETIAAMSGAGILPVEVFLHGRPPLAFSWRCYSARFADRAQERCGTVCRAQGELVFRNLEDEDGFVVDGPVVMPGQVVSTVEQARGYAGEGAELGRLWVGPGDVAPVATAFARLLSGEAAVDEVRRVLEASTGGTVRYDPVARRRLS